MDKVRIYSTKGACVLAQTTREAVRHLQKIEVWFAKVGRYHQRWSEADIATIAIISHVVQDLGLRVNAISPFSEDIWRICVDHDCTELMSKRLFISTVDSTIELAASGDMPKILIDGLVVPRLPIALAVLERHLARTRRGG